MCGLFGKIRQWSWSGYKEGVNNLVICITTPPPHPPPWSPLANNVIGKFQTVLLKDATGDCRRPNGVMNAMEH